LRPNWRRQGEVERRMIIEPMLPDHWKIRELKRLSGRSEAVEWLIRLWGSCQMRKSPCFDVDKPAVISATCSYDGDPSQFVGWLIQVGFLEQEGPELVAHGWAEHNAQLIANWTNGKKGGRPKTHGLAENDNGLSDRSERSERSESAAEPTRNKVRSEGGGKQSSASPDQPNQLPKSVLDVDSVQLPLILRTPEFRKALGDWIEHRKSFKPSLTSRALELAVSKCQKLGMDRAIIALQESVINGWKGIFEPKTNGTKCQSTTEQRGEYSEPESDFSSITIKLNDDK